VYEAWQHMTVFNAEVVVRTKHISGNHSRMATTMLLEICPVEHRFFFTDDAFSRNIGNILNRFTAQSHQYPPVMNIKHSLCISIAKVRLMRWSVVDLVQRK